MLFGPLRVDVLGKLARQNLRHFDGAINHVARTALAIRTYWHRIL
jgi:hypothetical protein